ncbi:MAG: ECF transporter S component, partial [Defluviitaleaceae bacterium]|nr:ECF transporter S component [Defluviitaleaceae bacterium]
LIPGFLPFNLINWSLNAALVMLLYKPVKTALQSARIISPPNAQQNDTDGAEKTRFFSPGILIASAFVIITCVLWIMILRGIF